MLNNLIIKYLNRKIMSAMQYYVGTDIDVGSMGQTCMVCPYFLEREVKTMEITGIALQTVAAGEAFVSYVGIHLTV